DIARLADGTIYARCYLKPTEPYQNPGGIDHRQFLDDQGLLFEAFVKNPGEIELLYLPERIFPLTALISQAREYLFQRIDTSFAPREAGVLKAAALGNSHFLDKEIAENFRASGTYHILVISGAHIALLAFLLVWLARLFIKRRWLI